MSTDLLGNPAHAYSYNASKIKALIEEYKSVRDYYSCDYYPVFGFPVDDTTWAGWQFDKPETGSGIILAFRRDRCLADRVKIFPGGINKETEYRFEDADTGEITSFSGQDLIDKGYEIYIPEKRDSRLIRYHSV
jgi:hypothetical protein